MIYAIICKGRKRLVKKDNLKDAHAFGRLIFPNESFTTREATDAEKAIYYRQFAMVIE